METIQRLHLRSTPKPCLARCRSQQDKERSHRLHLHFPKLRITFARLKWQRDGESGTDISLTRDFDLTIVSLHNSVEHGKAKSDSFSVRFGCKKRVEYLR